MAHKVYPMTPEGKVKLQKKLENLRLHKRPEVIKRIKVALSYGDLSENTEYTSAKNEQALLESQIKTTETMLQYSKVIDSSKSSNDVVDLGKTVTFRKIPGGKPMTYTIVGQSEADPTNKKISNDSPIAKGLIGHHINETVKIRIPIGKVNFKILKIA